MFIAAPSRVFVAGEINREAGMFEAIVETLFDLVGDLILQVNFEVLAEFGLESLKNSIQPAKTANPFYAACGLFILGAMVGLLGSLLFSHPLWHKRPIPGVSLLLAPLGAGLVMQQMGSWRRKKGGNPSCLATFWGGAAFALGMALVRWLMVGRG